MPPPGPAGAAAPAPETPSPPPPPHWGTRLFGTTRKVVVWVVAAVAGTVIGVYVTRWLDDGPPTGEVVISSVTRNVSREMFYGRAQQIAEGELEGLSIQITRTSEHTSPHGCGVRWTILDADGPNPVNDPALKDQEARDVRGDALACTGAADAWVPLALSLGIYTAIAVQIDFFAGEDKLDSATSERIDLG